MSNGSFLQPAYIWWPHLLNTKSHTSISALSSDHPVPRLSIIPGSVFRDKIIIHHRRQHHMILSKRRLFSLKLNSIWIGFLPLLCMYTYKLCFVRFSHYSQYRRRKSPQLSKYCQSYLLPSHEYIIRKINCLLEMLFSAKYWKWSGKYLFWTPIF